MDNTTVTDLTHATFKHNPAIFSPRNACILCRTRKRYEFPILGINFPSDRWCPRIKISPNFYRRESKMSTRTLHRVHILYNNDVLTALSNIPTPVDSYASRIFILSRGKNSLSCKRFIIPWKSVLRVLLRKVNAYFSFFCFLAFDFFSFTYRKDYNTKIIIIMIVMYV